jgi:hypothetical protein
VLFKDSDVHAGAGEQKSRHDSRRPSADDAALCGDRLWHGLSTGIDRLSLSPLAATVKLVSEKALLQFAGIFRLSIPQLGGETGHIGHQTQ